MKGLQCFLVVAVLVAGCLGACPNGWEEIEGNCYAFTVMSSVWWQEARDYCISLGGDLADVRTPDELRGIYVYIMTYHLTGSFWIGGSDATVEDDWVWVKDNTRVDRGTPFWALHSGVLGPAHEPNGGSDENCLALDEQRKYYFNDLPCTDGHHPLCQL